MANSSIRNLNIDGNLVISGSTTQLDVNTVVVDDNNITINDIATPLDANANLGGLTLRSNDASGDKTIKWLASGERWELSENLDIETGKEYRINNVSILNATTLGASVVNSSLTNLGALTGLTVDNISIDGSTIGLVTDTNLITLTNNTVTVAGTVVASATPGFTGDGSGITGISTANIDSPGTDGQILYSDGATGWGALTSVPITAGGTGAVNATTARTNLGLGTIATFDSAAYAENDFANVLDLSTSQQNIGLGANSSPTFGSTGTSGLGSINVHTSPDAGSNLGVAGVFARAIPPAAGSGHRFYTGIGNSSGGYVISHKVTSDAGVDSGTASIYLYTVDSGKKVYVGGTYPSMTTTNAYINDLAYPTADGSAGQVIKTDGAGVLSFTSVAGIGALIASNNLSDLASAATARTNLGLGTAAVQNIGVFAQVANNLSDVTAATARTNLGITATGADTAYAFRANNLSDLASAATARTNLGITATGADTAYAFRANNLSDLANAATARTNLGLGTIATQAANAIDIDGGAIDGATIGANVAQPAIVTTFTSTGINDDATSTAMTIASNQDTTFAQGIKVGNLAGAAGAGNIRWSGTDFQGHDGTDWKSFTSAAVASVSGNIANFTSTQAITSVTYVDIPGYTTAITVSNSNIINVQVAVDLDGPESNNHSFVQLVRVVGGTPTVLYEDESGSSAAGQGDHFNTSYADAHGQSNGTVITYKLMARVSGGTLSVNPNATNAQIFVYEITTNPTAVTSVFGQTGDVTSADYGSVA